jgi:predicted transcriptional regulator
MNKRKGPRPFLTNPFHLGVLLDEETNNKLEEIAIGLKISKSEVARQAIVFYLNRSKVNNPVKEEGEF